MSEPRLQRQTELKLEEDELLRTKSPGLQQVTSRSTGNIAPSIVHEVLRLPGRSLDPPTRGFMQLRLGHNFSQVRIHTDGQAAESARVVNALAYTVGRDIVFGAGQYTPHTDAGRQLLAHELVHTIQQRSGQVGVRSTANELSISKPSDSYEREADIVADQVMIGTSDPVGMHRIRRPRIHQVQPHLARVNCSNLSYRNCTTGIHNCGRGGSGTCGWVGLSRGGCICVGATQSPVAGGRSSEAQTDEGNQGSGSCNVELCFIPLPTLIDMGVSPELAYFAAAHAFIQWNGNSVGFTREDGEELGDIRVIDPEPGRNDPNKRCVRARLRRIPTPTLGQLTSLTPIGAISDITSYGIDFARSLQHCGNPSCGLSHQRIQNMLVDRRRGLYNLFDENCETWARNVLGAACLEAPEIQLGRLGNIALNILRETPGGNLYHIARLLMGRTRPLPEP